MKYLKEFVTKIMVLSGLLLFVDFLPLIGKDKHFFTWHLFAYVIGFLLLIYGLDWRYHR